jgi:uncharacterized protein (UPF0262 family)
MNANTETPDQDTQRIIAIHLDEKTFVRRRPEVEHERKVAIFDLLEENFFSPLDTQPGPFTLHLGLQDNRLVIDIHDEADFPIRKETLPLKPFQSIVKDYFLICESYYGAIKTASPAQIEAIDMGRRGLHNEGAEQLRARLEGKVDLDKDTSRRLFTLICVLHIRG